MKSSTQQNCQSISSADKTTLSTDPHLTLASVLLVLSSLLQVKKEKLPDFTGYFGSIYKQLLQSVRGRHKQPDPGNMHLEQEIHGVTMSPVQVLGEFLGAQGLSEAHRPPTGAQGTRLREGEKGRRLPPAARRDHLRPGE